MKDDQTKNEMIPCAQGIFNAIIFSLPIWGILYILLRLFYKM